MRGGVKGQLPGLEPGAAAQQLQPLCNYGSKMVPEELEHLMLCCYVSV